MAAERWEHVKQLFFDALDRTVEERTTFLDAACGDDDALRAEVDALLAADARTPPFLDGLPDWLAGLLAEETPLGPSDPLVGRTVGPYRVVSAAGHGGMGAVYLAERDDVEKQVALKLVRSHLATPEIRQRFLSERRILARLEHPHIARLLDAGVTDDGTPYFAMEYVAGEPITAYCDRRRLGVAGRLALFRQVCEAVRYAHQNLVIHRDLKPGNILVTPASTGTDSAGQVRLLDFGIAKPIEDDGTAAPLWTRTGLPVMTPAYAAPEQVRGETVTTATDVYALGVLLYELLVGHRPYDVHGRTASEIERIVCETEPLRPSTAVRRRLEGRSTEATSEPATEPAAEPATEPTGTTVAPRSVLQRLHRQLAGDLDTICMKALEKEPARRYPSAEALLEDLHRYLAGLPVKARPQTLRYRARKFAARHRWSVAAGALVVASLLGGLGAALWQARAAHRAAGRAEAALARSETVTTFLMDLLDAGNPRRALGDTLTVYDLLARGAERATALADEPLVQAQLLEVVGDVYDRMGQPALAQPLLERALTLRRALQDPAHPDVAASLHHVATVLRSRGRYAEALTLARDALALRRTALGPAHPDVATSTNLVASLLQDLGRYAEAEPLFREVLALRRRILQPTDFDLVTAMNNLALLLHRKGDLDEAEALFREVVAIDRATLGEAHPDMAIDLHNLGMLRLDRGAYDDAEALLQEALAMHHRMVGADHPRVSNVLGGLSGLRRQQGRYAEAERYIRRALAIDSLQLGPDHPTTILDRNALGVLLHVQGAPAAAESLLRQVLDQIEARLGPDHPHTAEVMASLADVLATRGDPAAAALYRDALAIYRDHLGQAHPSTRQTRERLAALCAVPDACRRASP